MGEVKRISMNTLLKWHRENNAPEGYFYAVCLSEYMAKFLKVKLGVYAGVTLDSGFLDITRFDSWNELVKYFELYGKGV